VASRHWIVEPLHETRWTAFPDVSVALCGLWGAGAGAGPGLGVSRGERDLVMTAAHHHLDTMSAIAVSDLDRWAVGVGLPAVAPLHQCDNRGQEVKAFVGEAIFVAFALAGFSVRHALHHCRFDQGVQAFAEQVAGAPDVGLELLEAPRSVESFPQYQKRPLLPDNVECAFH
jgi:hypothetical protein